MAPWCTSGLAAPAPPGGSVTPAIDLPRLGTLSARHYRAIKKVPEDMSFKDLFHFEVLSFLKIFLEDISPLYGTTDARVLDFWVSKQGWAALSRAWPRCKCYIFPLRLIKKTVKFELCLL